MDSIFSIFSAPLKGSVEKSAEGGEAVQDAYVTETLGDAVPNKGEEGKPAQELKPARKIVTVSKLGSDHRATNKNNQDFAFNLLNMKVVLDGCGSGKHSEVGVRLFAQLFSRKVKEWVEAGQDVTYENFTEVVDSVFVNLLKVCNDYSFIFQNYCFTILICFELEDEFVVCSCGDGYIITQKGDIVEFIKLDDGEYPCYYIYNYIEDKSQLTEYKEGVSFKCQHFSKEEYDNVGVASDGLRFSEKLPDFKEKQKLTDFLRLGKGGAIELLINRNNMKNEMFHDDVSICF